MRVMAGHSCLSMEDMVSRNENVSPFILPLGDRMGLISFDTDNRYHVCGRLLY